MLDWLLLLVAGFLVFFVSFFYLSLYWQNRESFAQNPVPRTFPKLSFIVPVYNEEKSIRKTIDSIQSLDYPNKPFDIVVVNDASTDQTESILKKIKGIRFFTLKKNSGRAAVAKNEGIKHAKHDFIVSMDADSYPQKDCLFKMMGYFETDENIYAVTASHLPYQPKNIWERLQRFEYTNTNFFRKINTLLNAMYVVPGPLTIFRKKALKETGGFDPVALTEDIDLAFNILSRGHRIENALSAVVFTEAPKKLRALFRQRMRWFRGGIMVTKKYQSLLFNPKLGDFGVFIFPFVFVISGILLFIFLVRALFLLVLAAFNQLINIYSLFLLHEFNLAVFSPPLSDITFLFTKEAILFVPLLLVSLALLLLCFHHSPQKLRKRDSLDLMLYLFYWGFMMSTWWVYALLLELFNTPRKW